MRRNLTYWMVLVACCALLSWVEPCFAGKSVDCKILGVKKSALLTEGIPIALEIAVKKDVPLLYERTGVPKFIRLELRDPKGKRVAFRRKPYKDSGIKPHIDRLPEDHRFPVVNRAFLKSGTSWKTLIDLWDVFQIKSPGAYTVTVGDASEKEPDGKCIVQVNAFKGHRKRIKQAKAPVEMHLPPHLRKPGEPVPKPPPIYDGRYTRGFSSLIPLLPERTSKQKNTYLLGTVELGRTNVAQDGSEVLVVRMTEHGKEGDGLDAPIRASLCVPKGTQIRGIILDYLNVLYVHIVSGNSSAVITCDTVTGSLELIPNATSLKFVGHRLGLLASVNGGKGQVLWDSKRGRWPFKDRLSQVIKMTGPPRWTVKAEAPTKESERIRIALERQTKMTPLHFAAKQGNIKFASAMLAKKDFVDANAQDADGNTALHLAVGAQNRKFVDLLLKHGVNVNIKNKKGQTAIDLAKSKELSKALLSKGAKKGSKVD